MPERPPTMPTRQDAMPVLVVAIAVGVAAAVIALVIGMVAVVAVGAVASSLMDEIPDVVRFALLGTWLVSPMVVGMLAGDRVLRARIARPVTGESH